MKIKTRKLTLRSLPFRWRFSGLSEYFLGFMCARKSLKCATYIKFKRELINSRLKPFRKHYRCRARVSSIYQAASFAFLEGLISRTNSYTPAWSSSWIQEILKKSTVADSVSTDRLQGALLWLPVSKPQLWHSPVSPCSTESLHRQ